MLLVVVLAVPDVVVAVVPVVDVAVVCVVTVLDVSVAEPAGIAEVEVIAEVSVVDIVPVVPVAAVSVVDIVEPVSVTAAAVSVFVFCSFLQANPKSATAVTVRTAKDFFINIPSLNLVSFVGTWVSADEFVGACPTSSA